MDRRALELRSKAGHPLLRKEAVAPLLRRPAKLKRGRNSSVRSKLTKELILAAFIVGCRRPGGVRDAARRFAQCVARKALDIQLFVKTRLALSARAVGIVRRLFAMIAKQTFA